MNYKKFALLLSLSSISGYCSVFIPAIVAGEYKYAIDHWFNLYFLIIISVSFSVWYSLYNSISLRNVALSFLIGFFTVILFPIWSIIEFIFNVNDHNLFPIENAVYIITGIFCGVSSVVGYLLCSLLKKI